jgi:nitroimidazol reductase NimA-like FMN-containing flavoprotein (pyridoxamine 5'-phosphate oxidase superfamily)
MYDSPNYPTGAEEADEFVAAARHGTLLACAPDGFPQATIVPFARDDDTIRVHLVGADPTCAALRANPSASFLVSEFLAWTPHDWVEPDNAARATLHFRAVLFSGTATVSDDPEDVASVLRLLLDRYEPEGTYDPITPADQRYGSRITRLAAVTLRVTAVQRKFKLGPYGPPELTRSVAGRLRERGLPLDAYAADVMTRVLDAREARRD